MTISAYSSADLEHKVSTLGVAGSNPARRATNKGEIMSDHLIEALSIEVRSVVEKCDTSLKGEIIKAIKEDEIMKECLICEEHGVLKIYVPDSL